MKHAAFLLGAILLSLTTSFAQDNSAGPRYCLQRHPIRILAQFSRSTSVPVEQRRCLYPLLRLPAPKCHWRPQPSIPDSSASEPPAQRPNVYGVFETYKWQAYAGLTRFSVSSTLRPSRKENMNGLDLGQLFITRLPQLVWKLMGDILGAIRKHFLIKARDLPATWAQWARSALARPRAASRILGSRFGGLREVPAPDSAGRPDRLLL